MTSVRLSAILLGVGLLAGSAVAHDDDPIHEAWRWVRFTVHDGLPSDRITKVLDAPDGTAWAATEDGLAHYDGWTWRAVDPADGPSGVVVDLAVDDDGRIWTVSDGGVHRGGVEGFEALALPDGVGAPTEVAWLPAAHGGALVMARKGRRSVVVRWKDGRAVTAQGPAPLVPAGVACIRTSVAGDVWFATTDGDFVWQDGWRDPFAGAVGCVRSSTMDQNRDGAGIAGFVERGVRSGLWEWEPGTEPRHVVELPFTWIDCAAIDASGDAVVSYSGGRVYRRRGGRWSLVSPPPSSLRGMRFARYRPNGDLWTCTAHGLFLLRTGTGPWTTWQHPADEAHFDQVHEVALSPDGELWVATTGGVLRQAPDGERVVLPQVVDSRSQTVTGLAFDTDGRAWIGSGSAFNGVRSWDGERWRKGMAAADGTKIGVIHKIRPDRAGRLWFLQLAEDRKASRASAGNVFVLEGGEIRRWEHADGLRARRIYDMSEGPGGAYWFATSHGVHRWRSRAWRRWDVRHGLRSGYVQSVEAHPRGGAWFGHFRGGLGRIQPQGAVSYVETPYGMALPRVWDLAYGADGTLWIATEEALLSRRGDAWAVFDHRTGMTSSHLWPVLPTGDRVYVGSRGGGTWMLDLSQARESPPRVTDLEVFPTPQGTDANWQVHSWWGAARDQGVESRYRVDLGAWSPWTLRTRARIAGLEHGEHVLGVQAKGRFGQVGVEETAVFAVRPPVWRTTAFLATVGGLSAALLLVVTVYIVRRRRHLRMLRQSEARFRAQYRGFPVPTYSWRAVGDDLVLEGLNDAAEAAPVVRREIGTRASEAYADRPDILEALATCVRERKSFQQELNYRSAPDAEEQDLRVSFSFVPPDIAMVHAEDITTRKRSQRGLIEYARQLDALNEIIIAGTRARELHTLCETVVDAVLELLGMEAAAVYVVDENERVARLEYERHLPSNLSTVAASVPIDEEPYRVVYVEGRSLFVDDYPDFDAQSAERAALSSFASVPILWDGKAIGSLNMASRTPHRFSVREKKIFESVGRYLGTVLARSRAEAELDLQLDDNRAARSAAVAANARLRAVSQRLVEVQEAERRRLSRELHDEVGQIVTGLKLVLESVSRGGPDAVRERLPEALRVTDELLRSVRELSLSLRPALLDDLGLVPALRWNLERFRSQSEMDVTFQERTGADQRFPADVETAVYRIVQEALTNVARHARARQVKVRLWTSGGSLFVQIADDGRGFDADAALLSSASLGVGGMRERAALVGGTVSIEASHGAGTRVTAEIPMSGAGEEAPS